MKILINKFGFLKIGLAVITIMFINWIVYVLEPGVESARKRQAGYAPQYIGQLIDKNQKALDAMAKEITSKPNWKNPDLKKLYYENKTNDEVESVIPGLLKEDRSVRPYKTSIWFSDSAHNFLTGTPGETFAFLNNIYDKHIGLIKSDRFYDNRDEFLSTFVDISDEIDFSVTTPKQPWQKHWRFYETTQSIYEQRAKGVFVLSSRVVDASNQLIGQLSMKLDDTDNYYLIYADRGDELRKNHKRYLWLINICCLLVIWYLLPAWVYGDAKRRGVRKPVFWAFVVLLSPFIGWVVYLLIRPKTVLPNGCPKCMGELPPHGEYCPHCGFQVVTQNCRECLKPVDKDWTFCSACGTKLTIEPVESIESNPSKG